MNETHELVPDDFIESHDPIGAKDEHGKLDLTLVPIMPMWKAIARVREFGVQKYKNPENWKGVSKEQFWRAFLRHTGEVIDRGFEAKDYETGLLHLWHMACNLCFIIALMEIERFNNILFGENE